ncbi:hypothetical protein QIW31_04855 [Francisellaceae bacterium CB299]
MDLAKNQIKDIQTKYGDNLILGDFALARGALAYREGTTLLTNIAYASKTSQGKYDREHKNKDVTYYFYKRADELSDQDKDSIAQWLSQHNDVGSVIFTYFASNFHDLQYGRGMESILGHVKRLSFDRDITKWNQDNIRLLMFLAANNKANIAPTRYDALEKFQSYIYEVPSNVKQSTTYWRVGPYAKTAGLSGLVTDVFNYPRLHTRVLQDSNAYVDCSSYTFTA